MKHICMFLIRFYRKFISGAKIRPTCRFCPTCSQYALTAYEKHGYFGGTYLSVKRVLKCNPFFRGGIDNVPEKITFRKKPRTNNENGEK